MDLAPQRTFSSPAWRLVCDAFRQRLVHFSAVSNVVVVVRTSRSRTQWSRARRRPRRRKIGNQNEIAFAETPITHSSWPDALSAFFTAAVRLPLCLGERDVILIAIFPTPWPPARSHHCVRERAGSHHDHTLLTAEEVDKALAKSVAYQPPGR